MITLNDIRQQTEALIAKQKNEITAARQDLMVGNSMSDHAFEIFCSCKEQNIKELESILKNLDNVIESMSKIFQT